MKPTKRALLTSTLLIGLGLHSAARAEETVNIYNWYEYFGETTLSDFETRFGIKTVYDTFDSPEVLETKMLTGSSGYDVVYPGSSQLTRHIPAGAYRKLDKSKLTNLGNIDSDFMAILAETDPGNEYAVPYTWGTTGIAYDHAEVEARLPGAPVDSLQMIFDPEIVSKFQDCGVFVLDSPTSVVAAALTYLGKDANSEDAGDLDAAMAVLDRIRPYLRHFNNGVVINDLANSDLCLALTYNGDVGLAYARAEEAGKPIDIAYAIPKEGAEIYFDVMAIPADAPHPDAAHTFINYILEPQVAAGITNYTYFANANKAATELVNADIRDDPGTYPPAEIRDKLYPVRAHSQEYTRLLNRAWTRFKSGQ